MSIDNGNNKRVKFHGQLVVEDDDPISVRNKEVLEINSNYELVLRYYDENGEPDDESFKIDPIPKKIDSSSTDVLSHIRRQAGNKRFLISQSAVELISKFDEI